ncbi:HAMP domain-containing protein, partial [Rhizobium sp. C1]|uniref:HAMP domain-containing protein n=1 Tax=Rhizobium sp. C1 TaxID=1349799 RepID=UPI002E7BA368
MSVLANISIKAKILSIVVPLCVVGLGATGSMAYFYKNADSTYSDFLTTDNVAAIQMVRAATAMVSVPYSAYQLVAYNNSDPGYAGVKAFYDANKKDIVTRLDKVVALTPEAAGAVNDFKTRAQALFDSIDKAVQTDTDGKQAEAAKMLATIDPAVDKWRADLRAYNDTRQADLLKRSDDLTDITNRTITMTLGVVGVVFLLGIIGSLYIATRGITAPISRLRARMTGLAAGDTASKIEGLERKDEVGSMAKAVLVFQENALERLRLEQETEANRSMSEKERIEREKQKAREAADV